MVAPSVPAELGFESDAMALKESVISGAGITLLPDITIEEDVAAGRLEIVLPQYSCHTYPLYMVYPRREHLPAKIRVVAEFIREVFRVNPP